MSEPLTGREEQALRESFNHDDPDMTGGERVWARYVRRLLATLDRERAGEGAAPVEWFLALTQIADGDLTARNPREIARKALLAVPGLPSSFPVGSVSGSPKLPHAYNVREEEAP